jgi:hypothetical protein
VREQLPVTYDPKTRSFHCPHCDEHEEVRAKDAGDPEKLTALKELTALDHSECHTYPTVKMARDARKYRKTAKRIALTQAKKNPMASAGCFRA